VCLIEIIGAAVCSIEARISVFLTIISVLSHCVIAHFLAMRAEYPYAAFTRDTACLILFNSWGYVRQPVVQPLFNFVISNALGEMIPSPLCDDDAKRLVPLFRHSAEIMANVQVKVLWLNF